jgi:hypothetical protein
LQKITEAKW